MKTLREEHSRQKAKGSVCKGPEVTACPGCSGNHREARRKAGVVCSVDAEGSGRPRCEAWGGREGLLITASTAQPSSYPGSRRTCSSLVSGLYSGRVGATGPEYRKEVLGIVAMTHYSP